MPVVNSKQPRFFGPLILQTWSIPVIFKAKLPDLQGINFGNIGLMKFVKLYPFQNEVGQQ